MSIVSHASQVGGRKPGAPGGGWVPTRPRNTRIVYRYTDASNCKREEAVVVAGVLTFGQVAPLLDEGRFFIPGDVGLPELQNRFSTSLGENDHVWHAIEAVDETPDAPTLRISADRLLRRLHAASWDEEAAWRRAPGDARRTGGRVAPVFAGLRAGRRSPGLLLGAA